MLALKLYFFPRSFGWRLTQIEITYSNVFNTIDIPTFVINGYKRIIIEHFLKRNKIVDIKL